MLKKFTILFALLIISKTFNVHAQTITTYAGNGTSGYSGDGGAATSAELNAPGSMAFDAAGNLYVVDRGNGSIRAITPAGIISTVASSAYDALDIRFDGLGNAFISSAFNYIYKLVPGADSVIIYAGNGDAGYEYTTDGPGTALNEPVSMAVDQHNNLYFADHLNQIIRKITTTDTVYNEYGYPSDADYTGDGGAGSLATFDGPMGIAFDGSGNLFICDQGNNVIREVNATTGNISTVAGSGFDAGTGMGGCTGGSGESFSGTATGVSFYFPSSVAFDASGNMYIADFNNNVVWEKQAGTSSISIIAGSPCINSYLGDGGPATSATLSTPYGLAVDASGNIFISDWENHVIRKISCAAPALPTITGPEYMCVGNTYTVTGSATGSWHAENSDVTVFPDGLVKAYTPGIDSIELTVSNTCGSSVAKLGVRVYSVAECDSITAVTTVNLPESLNLFPNPARNSTTLVLPPATPAADLIIADMLGNAVLQKTVSGNEVNIDLKNMSPGNYIIKVITPGKSYMQQLSVY